MKKVYFISGLGADKRVFSYLDLSFCEPVFIDWIQPEVNETLKAYALRLRKEIPEKNPVIVGISFGGMLVTEMNKADKNMKGIIVSSNKISAEFPRYLRITKYFPVYKWTPVFISKKVMLTTAWLSGRKDKTQKKIMRQIIMDSDINFVRWAIHAILQWKNKEIPTGLIHIHGTADKLLPYRLVKPDYTIKQGSHVMTMDKHAEISDLLKKLI